MIDDASAPTCESCGRPCTRGADRCEGCREIDARAAYYRHWDQLPADLDLAIRINRTVRQVLDELGRNEGALLGVSTMRAGSAAGGGH